MTFRKLLAVAIAASFMLPVATHDAFAAGKNRKKTASVTVTKKWRGYGFLPCLLYTSPSPRD